MFSIIFSMCGSCCPWMSVLISHRTKSSQAWPRFLPSCTSLWWISRRGCFWRWGDITMLLPPTTWSWLLAIKSRFIVTAPLLMSGNYKSAYVYHVVRELHVVWSLLHWESCGAFDIETNILWYFMLTKAVSSQYHSSNKLCFFFTIFNHIYLL